MKKNFKKRYIIIPVTTVLIISAITICMNNKKKDDIAETLALASNVTETKINSTDDSKKELEDFEKNIPIMPDEKTVFETETDSNETETLSGDELINQNGVANPEFKAENMENFTSVIQLSDEDLSSIGTDIKASDLIDIQKKQENQQESQEEPILETLTPEQIENAKEVDETLAAPEIDYKESIYTISDNEITSIEQKGLELLKQAGDAGINIDQIDNSIKVMPNSAYFAPQGVEKYIEITKNRAENYYDVDIYVTVNPERSQLNNEALKQLCKLISYNNDNVYNAIMDDYTNNIYPNADQWYKTDYNFEIRGHIEKENNLVRYSIRY